MSTVLDRYVVIGNPVAHSKSPDIHARFAAQTGQNLSYDRLLVPLGGFADAVRELMRQHVKGANVTVPFKLDAYAVASMLTERARAAGAVNTLKFEDGAIVGDNTDGVGLVTDVVRNAGIPMQELPPQQTQPAASYMPPEGGWRAPDTGDLQRPASVVEGTTKLLKKDEPL